MFDQSLKCIGWECDISGCYRKFDQKRLWRDHHLQSGPHKGKGLKAYQLHQPSHLTLRQTSRLRQSLIIKIAEEKEARVSAIAFLREQEERLHSHLICLGRRNPIEIETQTPYYRPKPQQIETGLEHYIMKPVEHNYYRDHCYGPF